MGHEPPSKDTEEDEMAATITTGLFVDMTDDELREAYTAWRGQMSAWSALAAPRRRDGGRSASGMGRALRNVEIIEAVARKRQVRL